MLASKEPWASVSAVACTSRAGAVSPRAGHASDIGSRAAVPRSGTNATPLRSSDSITERETNAHPSPAATRPSWAWSDVTWAARNGLRRHERRSDGRDSRLRGALGAAYPQLGSKLVRLGRHTRSAG